MKLLLIVARISIAVLFIVDFLLLLLYFLDFVALTTINEQNIISVAISNNREYKISSMNAECKNAKFRLLHIINPYHSQDVSSLLSQNMTMLTISNALQQQNRGKCSHHRDLLVNVLALFSEDDDEKVIKNSNYMKIPSNFIRRTISKVANNTNGGGPPLLRTILTHGLAFAREENFTHVIFSNMDINIVPSFYEAVSYLLNCTDTLLINR